MVILLKSEDTVSFDDVKEHWAKDDIEYLAGKKFINGYNGLFMPENKFNYKIKSLIFKTVEKIKV